MTTSTHGGLDEGTIKTQRGSTLLSSQSLLFDYKSYAHVNSIHPSIVALLLLVLLLLFLSFLIAFLLILLLFLSFLVAFLLLLVVLLLFLFLVVLFTFRSFNSHLTIRKRNKDKYTLFLFGCVSTYRVGDCLATKGGVAVVPFEDVGARLFQ